MGIKRLVAGLLMLVSLVSVFSFVSKYEIITHVIFVFSTAWVMLEISENFMCWLIPLNKEDVLDGQRVDREE